MRFWVEPATRSTSSIALAPVTAISWVELTKDGLPQTFPKGICGHGRNEIKSAAPFSLYMFGADSYASYGYAGGSGLRPLNQITINAPHL